VGVYNKDAAGNTVHGSAWVTGGPDYTAGFHTFAVDWQPTFISYYVDGVEKIRVTDPVRIPTEPMYVLANLAVGGTWPGSPTDATQFPQDLEIDYIHVFEQKSDTTVPTLSMTPANGTAVKRGATVPLTATATDDVSVSRVDFYAGSTLLCTDTTAPYGCNWKAPTKKGLTTLSAKAYDPTGNVATRSSTISVR
jgi:beta-glucanase (GH16 family)